MLQGRGLSNLVCKEVSESVHTSMLQEEMGGVVGITVNADYYYPLTDSAEDKEAAERALIYKLGW